MNTAVTLLAIWKLASGPCELFSSRVVWKVVWSKSCNAIMASTMTKYDLNVAETDAFKLLRSRTNEEGHVVTTWLVDEGKSPKSDGSWPTRLWNETTWANVGIIKPKSSKSYIGWSLLVRLTWMIDSHRYSVIVPRTCMFRAGGRARTDSFGS